MAGTEKKPKKKQRKVRSNAELIASYQEKIIRAAKTIKKYKAKIERIKKLESKDKYKSAVDAVKSMTLDELEKFKAWQESQKTAN